MQIRAARLAYFSPTQTTRRVLESIAAGLGLLPVEHEDLTPPDGATRPLTAVPADALALLGAPVYGGRLPQEGARRLGRLESTGGPAVVVVVYGNRAYEDALLELRDLAVRRGFHVVAAAAFIGEHSYSRPVTPIAAGRPDAADLEIARRFGQDVHARLEGLGAMAGAGILEVPGSYPYKEGGKPSGITPTTRAAVCAACGACVQACPTNAIAVDGHAHTDPERCIMCCACLRACPREARVVEHERVLQAAQRLSSTCAAPKQPQLFGVSS